MNTSASGVVYFHRAARVFPPPLDSEPISMAPPPRVGTAPQGSIFQMFLPMLGSVSLIAFSFVYNNPIFRLIAIGVAVLMLTVGIGMRLQQKHQFKKQRRRNAELYRRYVSDLDDRLKGLSIAQRDRAARVHPGVDGVWSLVNEGRYMWERRAGDPDFMHLRIGLGSVPLAAPLALDLANDPLVEYEPDLLEEATRLYEQYRELPHLPVTIAGAGLGSLAVIGAPDATRAWTRSVLCSMAALHAPDDVKVLAFFPPEAVEEWTWMKWLPHVRDSVEPSDDSRPRVALAVDPRDFGVLLSQLIQPRIDHLKRLQTEKKPDHRVRFQQAVVIIDDLEASGVTDLEIYDEMLRRAASIGVLAIVMVSDKDRVPTTVGARVELTEGGWLGLTESGHDGRREAGVRADAAGVEICEAVARALAPLRLKTREGRAHQVDSEGLLDLLHLAGPGEITEHAWRRDVEDLLQTPIGIAEDGSPVVLDLKESAEDGMGPHGLIVGATGSGKSELLRTLVAGLAVGHSPEDLAMVLVDYKGGASFAGLSGLPHTAGTITNIERDLTLVDRMHEALFGELERRQRLLQEAGGFDRARDYQEWRRAHPEAELPALPSLLVIIDEFGELLANKPDFIDLFVSMGRLGRSLGVHLLLATQRLETGRLRGLESHLRYRICLRTFSADESQAVLGVREAYELPPLPGLGYLSVDGGLQQFKAALSTRPFRERRGIELAPAPGVVRAFSVEGSSDALAVLGDDTPRQVAAPVETRPDGTVPTEMEVAVDRLNELVLSEDRARQVWLSPLPAALSLDEVVDPDKEEDRSPDDPGWLEVTVGLKDRPRQQMQLPMTLSFTGRQGHCAIVGAPRSGKSTFVQALIGSLALSHDPRDLQVYAIDFGGGGLHAMSSAPHVGAVYSRNQGPEIRRLVREMQSIVENRIDLFRDHGIASMREFHHKRRRGEITDDYGEVFIVIDNWALLTQELDDLASQLTELAGASLHYGVHLVITSNRWMDIRMNLRDNLGGRVELRLNDPLDSEIDRKAAESLPDDVPGRGLSREREHLQVALPRLDGRSDIGGLNAGIEALLQVVEERWQDSPRALPIRMLPLELQASHLPPAASDERGVTIGLEEFRLEPVRVDLLGAHAHLLVFGDSQCGKTNLLRVMVEGIRGGRSPREVKLAIVDYRRALIDLASAKHVVAYTYTSEMTAELANEVRAELRRRMPSNPASLTSPVQAKEWEGPHVVLVVDDYDLVASPSGNPLDVLTDVLAHGRDVGFHVILARRVSGTARGAFESFYQRLVELGSPGIIMNGDPQEGPILGAQKAEPLAPGRGYLVVDRRSTLIQTVLSSAPDT
ncbi:MAG: type VII secretion protein EccCb [Actinomycetota bacterium]